MVTFTLVIYFCVLSEKNGFACHNINKCYEL